MRQAAVALVVNEDTGLFLSVSRKNDSTLLGFPGGQQDSGEILEQTMVRELFEETGLKALKYELFFKDYDGHDFETTCFLVTEYEGEAYSKELGVVSWVDSKELENGPFGWFNKKVFEKYYSNNYISCQSHCCLNCNNCKYNYENCPVLTKKLVQDNPCENCDITNSENSKISLPEETLNLINEHIKIHKHLSKAQLIAKALRNLPLDKEKLCNCCGLTCNLRDPDGTGNYGLINAEVVGGYASTPGNGSGALDDLNNYKFSLCEFCCDFLFKNFIIPPSTTEVNWSGEEIYPVEPFISAEERVKNDEWREMKDKFFAEYEKRNLARKLK